VEKSSLEKRSFAMNATLKETTLELVDALSRMQKVVVEITLNAKTMISALVKLQKEIGKDGANVSKDKSGMYRKR
jgi:hypothetical protein